MKKQRVSPITSFQLNSDFNGGDLPKPEDVNQTIATLTGKADTPPSVVSPKTNKMENNNISITEKQTTTNETFKGGRPLKEGATGRLKFTTMLHADLIKELKRTAIDENMSVADLLEIAIKKYLNN